MSVSVAGMLDAGKEPGCEAAIVKDVGTIWEQKLPRGRATSPLRRSRMPSTAPIFEAWLHLAT